VEFDDQGWLWDRQQMNAVLDRFSVEDSTNGLLVMVFVHGWKHNASFDDDNVGMFRTNLTEIAEMERQLSRDAGIKPRKVAGMYVGWRGLSSTAWVLRQLTFWDRKNAAHEVGRGGVTELFSRLEDLRNNSHLLHRGETERRPTQLIIVGHSFGGALTFSALAPLLAERAVQTAANHAVGPVRGFGDLVVLINPAFEAARFEVLYSISTNQTWYPTNQSVNLAIFTSKTDDATKIAFPLGRWFSTFWEKNRDANQKISNRKAVGHYAPFITHDLIPSTNQPVAVAAAATPKPRRSPTVRSGSYKGQETIPGSVSQVKSLKRQIQRHRESNVRELPDRSYQFSNSKLVPRDAGILRMPVMNVSVAREIIPNHGDIDTQAFLTFLREFIGAFAGDESESKK
jgi:hypothetical protein